MTELFYDKYDGEMLFDIVDCIKENDEYTFVLKSVYKGEQVGFQLSVPIVNRRSLFKSFKFVLPSGQMKFSTIGEESDRFICALEELLKPVYKSTRKFTEEIETADFTVINSQLYDIDSDKVYIKIYNGEDQSGLDEDEKINLEMNFAFSLGSNRASLIEVRDGYSADLVAVLMK